MAAVSPSFVGPQVPAPAMLVESQQSQSASASASSTTPVVQSTSRSSGSSSFTVKSRPSRSPYRTHYGRSSSTRFENIYEETGDDESSSSSAVPGPSKANLTLPSSASSPNVSATLNNNKGGANQRRRLYYAVRQGHKPGVYRTWEEAEQQFKGHPDPRWQTFRSPISAQEYVSGKSCFNDRKWAEAVPDPFFQDAQDEHTPSTSTSSSSNLPLQERLNRDFTPTPAASAPSVLLPPLQPPRPSFATSSSSSSGSPSSPSRSSPLRQSVTSVSDENLEAEDTRYITSSSRRALFSRFSIRSSSSSALGASSKGTKSVPPKNARSNSSSSSIRGIDFTEHSHLPEVPSRRPLLKKQSSDSVHTMASAQSQFTYKTLSANAAGRGGLWSDVYLPDPARDSTPPLSSPEYPADDPFASLAVTAAPKFTRSALKKAGVVMPVSAGTSSPDRSRPSSGPSSSLGSPIRIVTPKQSHAALFPHEDDAAAAQSLHEKLAELAALEQKLLEKPSLYPSSASRSRSSSSTSSSGAGHGHLAPGNSSLGPSVSRETITSSAEGPSSVGTHRSSASSVMTHAHSDGCVDISHKKSQKRNSGLGRIIRALKFSSAKDEDKNLQTLGIRRGST